MPYKDDLAAAHFRIEQLEKELAKVSIPPPPKKKFLNGMWFWVLVPLAVILLAVITKHLDSMANNKSFYAILSGDFAIGAILLSAVVLVRLVVAGVIYSGKIE